MLLGLFAGKWHTRDTYICIHTKEVCPWRERGILSCCRPEFGGLRDSAAQSTWDTHSMGQALPCSHSAGFQMCSGTQTLCSRQRKQGISRHNSQNQTENCLCSCWRCQGQGEKLSPCQTISCPFLDRRGAVFQSGWPTPTCCQMLGI